MWKNVKIIMRLLLLFIYIYFVWFFIYFCSHFSQHSTIQHGWLHKTKIERVQSSVLPVGKLFLRHQIQAYQLIESTKSVLKYQIISLNYLYNKTTRFTRKRMKIVSKTIYLFFNHIVFFIVIDLIWTPAYAIIRMVRIR